MRLFLLALLASVSLVARSQTFEVMMETNHGNIRLQLYDDTPLHRDNFLKNVREGVYDGVLFHRVINAFMIQAGDTASRHAEPGAMLGDTPRSYTVPAEIRYPERYHKRGALAAAREGDSTNPERASSWSQFYIVYGRRMSPEQLDRAQARLDLQTGGAVQLTEQVRQAYNEQGGTPHLDGQYTVFGEVLEGLDVVKDIQLEEVDDNDRPLNDCRIIRAFVIE